MLCYTISMLNEGLSVFPLKAFVPFHPPSFARCTASTFFYLSHEYEKKARGS